ncbi:hypothetical protein IP84_12995 [beta proteobacterium AAP99]|nr:hypothetical protein IP84_12995 [beta proteobacterium AAP99]
MRPSALLRTDACVALLLALVLWASAPWAAAQGAPGRVPLATRLVKLMSEQVAALDAAAERRDAAALDALLAPQFEERSSAQPGTPLPRDAWMAQTQGRAARGVTQMAVREAGELAIASYLATTATGAGTAQFVVDVWRRTDSGWQLLNRYVSQAGNAALNPAPEAPATGANRKG